MKIVHKMAEITKSCTHISLPLTLLLILSYFLFIPAIPQVPKLPKTTWVDKIRTAVLTLMYMNHRLYKHLYSSTFDVPDYERENILYNNEVSIIR